AYQIFVEVINDKITSAPISLPKVYGNDSLKSKHNIYVAAHFHGNKLPTNFILGDNKWYEFHFNKKLKPLTKYRIYIRALAKSHFAKNQKIVFGKPNYLVASTKFPEIPKLVLIEESRKWLKVSWKAVKYEKFFYKLMIKEGGTVIFNKRVDKVPFILKDLKEGKSYKAYLSVCTKKSYCKSTNSTGMELSLISAPPESSMQLLIIIVAVGSVALLIIIAVAVICFLRRRKSHKQGFLKKAKSNDYAEAQPSKSGSTKQLNEEQVMLIETKQNGSAINGMEMKPIRAKPLNGKEESSTDPRTEWACPKDSIKIIKEIEHDGYGKICKGTVSSQKDDNSGSVMLRILKGR
ncbi:receptor-type tyrosine- phosphatase S-like, partial [Paramuricea clavata]